MRMVMQVVIPNDAFNAAVRDGSAGAKMQRILAKAKPEAAYFMEHDGHRSGILIVNMTETSQIPSFAEPWFLLFNAQVKFHPAMTPQDLAAAGLDALGKEWG
jgi:hypothetical protein